MIAVAPGLLPPDITNLVGIQSSWGISRYLRLNESSPHILERYGGPLETASKNGLRSHSKAAKYWEVGIPPHTVVRRAQGGGQIDTGEGLFRRRHFYTKIQSL